MKKTIKAGERIDAGSPHYGRNERRSVLIRMSGRWLEALGFKPGEPVYVETDGDTVKLSAHAPEGKELTPLEEIKAKYNALGIKTTREDTAPYRATGPAWRARLVAARTSFNYCGICGHTPKNSNQDEPNYAPLKWWDPDDGWKIGTLCRWCAEENLDVQPKPEDYAYSKYHALPVECDTDEDPIEAL